MVSISPSAAVGRLFKTLQRSATSDRNSITLQRAFEVPFPSLRFEAVAGWGWSVEGQQGWDMWHPSLDSTQKWDPGSSTGRAGSRAGATGEKTKLLVTIHAVGHQHQGGQIQPRSPS